MREGTGLLKKDEPRNFRPNGKEKKSQRRHTEIQRTRQTSDKEVQLDY